MTTTDWIALGVWIAAGIIGFVADYIREKRRQ